MNPLIIGAAAIGALFVIGHFATGKPSRRTLKGWTFSEDCSVASVIDIQRAFADVQNYSIARWGRNNPPANRAELQERMRQYLTYDTKCGTVDFVRVPESDFRKITLKEWADIIWDIAYGGLSSSSTVGTGMIQ